MHAALKAHYAQPGDRFEVPLEGFVIDIARGDSLIEIQTGSFAALGNKLDALLDRYSVLLVHPIARYSYIERRDGSGRRSPKRGSVFNLFDELVSVPTLIDHPSLSLEVVIVDVDKIQEWDPKIRRRRGGYRTVDRRLRGIVETHRFDRVEDLCRLLPPDLPARFTTADLARHAHVSRDMARKMAYCFRPLGVFDELERTKAGYVYRLSI